MNISIREHIKSNFKDTNIDEIMSSIDSSVEDKDEVTLPGLGVFFEILWSNSSDKEKEFIIETLYNNLKKPN